MPRAAANLTTPMKRFKSPKQVQRFLSVHDQQVDPIPDWQPVTAVISCRKADPRHLPGQDGCSRHDRVRGLSRR
jgi:hypothetical protein